MTPLHEVIINKKTTLNPIWIMRQAGRYLPEFREIRKKNPNFIELCLNQGYRCDVEKCRGERLAPQERRLGKTACHCFPHP